MILKNGLVTLVLLLTIVSTCVSAASADEFPILDKQVEIRQAHLRWTTAIQETSMVAVIEYIDEISNGTEGASELESLLEDFQAQTETIGSLTTHVAQNNALRQLRQISTDFRVETRKQMNEHNGRYLELANRVKTALEENQNELDHLKDAYWAKREENALAIFDTRVERAQTVLDALQARDYDTSEAQAKLDEITAKRIELEDAFDAKDNLAIAQIHRDIFELSKELARIVRDLQVEIPREVRVRHWVHVGERVVDWTATIITELDQLGPEVTELREVHAQAEADLEKAKEAFDAGDLEGAVDALEDLKTDLIELRDAYEELVFGGTLSGDLQATVESTSALLSDTIEEMEADL